LDERRAVDGRTLVVVRDKKQKSHCLIKKNRSKKREEKDSEAVD